MSRRTDTCTRAKRNTYTQYTEASESLGVQMQFGSAAFSTGAMGNVLVSWNTGTLIATFPPRRLRMLAVSVLCERACESVRAMREEE